MYFKVVRV